MKKTESKIVNKQQDITTYFCDICKNELKTSHYYEVKEAEIDSTTRKRILTFPTQITISSRSGEQYPEYTNTTTKKIDCCTDCFDDKIIPLIEKTFGIEFQEEEFDY